MSQGCFCSLRCAVQAVAEASRPRGRRAKPYVTAQQYVKVRQARMRPAPPARACMHEGLEGQPAHQLGCLGLSACDHDAAWHAAYLHAPHDAACSSEQRRCLAARRPRPRHTSMSRARAHAASPLPCTQAPLLIHGRKFGVRVWVLVSGHSPLRAWVHENGLVLFADTP